MYIFGDSTYLLDIVPSWIEIQFSPYIQQHNNKKLELLFSMLKKSLLIWNSEEISLSVIYNCRKI